MAASARSYGKMYLRSISISQCLCTYKKTKDMRKLSIVVIISRGAGHGEVEETKHRKC